MADQPLWAPWRMVYIRDDDGEREAGHCFLCHAITGEDPLVVYADDKTLAILNRFPYNPGHLLVAPRDHVADFKQFPDELAGAIDGTVRKAIRVLDDCMGPEGYNVGMNLGVAAGAGIPDHLHVHIVPRWNGDNNFMPVLGELRVIPEHLDATAAKLKDGFSRLENTV